MNEHGKDFNAIHSYMTTRLKKKGVPEELIKNKEQIRCYFNRQLNKICSIFEECSDEINNLDKTTKQLYALINYGEMWKKNNFKNDLKIDAKFKAHLNELIFKGYTFLKIGKKGKNVKLKTPVCKALKKIYYFENIYKSINQNLPKDIIIELLPASNYAWMKVHSLAQNPRVRVKCSLQKRLSSLIKYLEDRWNEQKYNNLQIDLLTIDNLIKSPKNHNEKNDEQIKMEDLVSNSNGSNGVNNENNESSINSQPIKKVFRVKPHQAHHRNLTGLKFTRIQPIPFNSQMDISLSAYLVKANSKLKTEQKVKRKNLNVNCSKKLKEDEQKQNSQENGLLNKAPEIVNHSEKSNTTHVLETVRELNFLKNIVSSNYNQENNPDSQINNDKNVNENGFNNNLNANNNQLIEEKSLHLPDPPPNATIAEWLSANTDNNKNELNKSDSNSNTLSPNKEHSAGKEDEQKESNKHKESHNEEENIYNKMKKIVDPLSVKIGWSVDEIEDLTIGELYLMLKKPNKIVLQYDWNIVKLQSANQNNHLDQQNINQSNENSTKDTTKPQSNLIAQHQNHYTNCQSLVSKLITAFTLELMSLNKDKSFTAADIENECKQNANDKNQRKTKKLKTNHSNSEDQVEPNDNPIESISTQQNPPNNVVSNDHELMQPPATNIITPVANVCSSSNNNKNSQSTANNNDKFVVPTNPPPKAANKKIINEKLIQEAKEQLCNIKFNNSRRNFRNGALIKQQQQQQQMQISNICQLLANKGTLTTVPVNVSSASANGQTALISVITQVNQNNNSVVPNTMQTTINLDGTQSIQTVQINNATTLNDLCNYVAKCSPSGTNEPTTLIQQPQSQVTENNSLNGNNSLNNSLNSINIELSDKEVIPIVPTTVATELMQNSTAKNHHYQEYTTLPPVPCSVATNGKTMTKNSVHPSLDFNTSILTDDKTNDKLNHFPDDKSVSFSNLLDISLSDPIFYDSAFPSDVSIDSTFSSKDTADQTLNTPIKLTNQKTSILNHNNSFSSQFNLFDSNLNGANRNESITFNDNWMAGNDISLSNIFDCEQPNYKSFDNASFKEDFNNVLNVRMFL